MICAASQLLTGAAGTDGAGEMVEHPAGANNATQKHGGASHPSGPPTLPARAQIFFSRRWIFSLIRLI